MLEQEFEKIGQMTMNKKNTSMSKSRIDPKDMEMMEAIQKVDDERDEELKKWKEEQKKKSGFSKLLKYNRPCILIFSACIASCISGSM